MDSRCRSIRQGLTALLIGLAFHPICAQSDSLPNQGTKNHRALQHYEKGNQWFDINDFAKALEQYNQALYLRPSYIDAYYSRAHTKEKLKDLDGALVDYEIILQLDTTFSEALFDRARLRYERKDYQRAVVDFQRLIKMPRHGTNSIYYKGLQLNSDDQAQSFAQFATTSNLKADIYNYLGLCHSGLEDYSSAMEAFNQAIELDGNEPSYYVNRGWVHALLGKDSEAIRDYKYALILEPENELAAYNLAQEGESMNDLSVSDYDQIIARNPDFPSPYVNRASAKMKVEDYIGALKDYDRAIDIEDQDAVIFINRGLAKEKLNDYAGALIDYNKAIAIEPDLADAYRNRGNAKSALKRWEEALPDYDLAIRLDDTNPRSYFNRGLVHHQLGHTEKVCKDLERALLLGLYQAQKAIEVYCDTERN